VGNRPPKAAQVLLGHRLVHSRTAFPGQGGGRRIGGGAKRSRGRVPMASCCRDRLRRRDGKRWTVLTDAPNDVPVVEAAVAGSNEAAR
jgi:hypothetical protein